MPAQVPDDSQQQLKEFGKRLREVRQSRGLTQQALARTAGLTGPAIVQIEAGRRQPSFKTLLALSKALGIGIDDLAGLPPAKDSSHTSKNAWTMTLADRISRLPPELQREAQDFVDYLWKFRVPKLKG